MRLRSLVGGWLVIALVMGGLGWPTVAVGQSESGGSEANQEMSGDSNLREAYQKEFAHLEAQKRALEERLVELESNQKEAIQKAERGRDRLQGELNALRRERDKLQGDLRKLQQRVSERGRGGDLLATTVKQASSTLKEEPVDYQAPGKDPAYASVLPTMFQKATTAISRSRSIRVEQGKFFLPSSEETRGKIVHIGDIASYGITDDKAGALAPAGKGRLKLWNKPTAETARALASGQMPESLGMFLYEALDENVERREKGGWVQKVNAGGVIGWVIVGLGILGLLFVLIRAATLAWIGSNAASLVREVTGMVANGELAEAKVRCEESSGAAARILGAVLGNLARERDEIEELVAEAMLKEAPRIERLGSAILVLAAVSPLLGLLGTVTGMIATFDIITKFGTGDPRMLSGGISEALVTTQLGLLVAIPLLLIGNLLKGWARRIEGRLERGALRLLNLVSLGATESDAGANAPPEDVPPPETDTEGGRGSTGNEPLGAI